MPIPFLLMGWRFSRFLMSLKAKLLLLIAVVLAGFLPMRVSAGEIKDFPAPFISGEDPYGRNTGIYLPSNTTDQELQAALLLRGELGEETWKEDMLVLGTLDTLQEARDNRILIAALSDLPEEAREKLPPESADLKNQGLCYEYEDEKGTVLVVTADEASLLPQTAAFFLNKEGYSNVEGELALVDKAPETAEETSEATESATEEQPVISPDLSLWPYPFRKDGEFLPLTIVFPDDISDTELNLLGRILAMKDGGISSETDISVIRCEDADAESTRNQIIIGTGDNNDYLTALMGEEATGDNGCLRLLLRGEKETPTLLLYGKDEESLSWVLRFLRTKENVNLMEGDGILVDQDLGFTVIRHTETEEEPKEEETEGSRLTLMICIAAGILTAAGLVLLIVYSIRDRKNERKV